MNERRTDFELLQRFARHGEQTAFADVVRRHLDLVIATALRKLTEPHAAQEVAQNVFTVLARKAWQFAPDDSLPAWLHKTALLESKSWLRGELRRRRREQTAAELGTTMKTPDDQPAFNALVPLLDEALLSLREKDRTALLLRFYESQSLRDVGASLGVGEDAAQKRVRSALQKLSDFIQRRGFRTATVAAAMAALQHTAASTPAGTTASVTRAALRTPAPTFAGLLALFALFMSLTRVQKVAATLTVAALSITWLWFGKHGGNGADSQAEVSAGETVVEGVTRREIARRLAGVALLPEQVVEADPQRYVEISGDVEFTSHPGSETGHIVTGKSFRKFSFVCITGTNEWWIHHDFTGGGETKWHFDGGSVYQSIRTAEAETGAMRDQLAWTVPYEQAKTNLGIHIWPSLDGHPLGDIAVNIPWLAFCSGTYLKREGRLIPLPAAILRHTRDRFAYTDQTETFNDALGLPRTIDLFTSKALLEASEDVFEEEAFFGTRYAAWKKKIVAELEEGVLTFHYAATDWTNFFGWIFPTKFEFFQEGRKYEQNGDWFCRGIGRVKSIRESTKPGNLFVPTMQQTIVDWRFRDATSKVNALIYVTTNAFASPTNDPALQERFAKKMGQMNRRR
ncbi:MAG: sigma-70 family RNA polymerase sigma factor [Verrucomicrobiae bacterium]|nr:sigma-70 family RNA polymerase sigma factor [Verrucomicrobiae bacterium]